MGYITFYQFVSENVINIVINNLLNCMTITVLIFCVHPLTLLEEYLCKWRVLDQSVPINLGSSLTWQYQDTSRKPCRTLALSIHHIVNAWNVSIVNGLHLTPLCYCRSVMPTGAPLLNSCQETSIHLLLPEFFSFDIHFDMFSFSLFKAPTSTFTLRGHG